MKTFDEYLKEYLNQKTPNDYLLSSELKTLYHCNCIGLSEDWAKRKLKGSDHEDVYEQIIVHIDSLLIGEDDKTTDITDQELENILHIYKEKLREHCMNIITLYCED